MLRSNIGKVHSILKVKLPIIYGVLVVAIFGYFFTFAYIQNVQPTPINHAAPIRPTTLDSSIETYEEIGESNPLISTYLALVPSHSLSTSPSNSLTTVPIWPYPADCKLGNTTVNVSPHIFDGVQVNVRKVKGRREMQDFIANAEQMYRHAIIGDEFQQFESSGISRMSINITSGNESEAYILSIGMDQISILANDVVSVLRALETLSQLITSRKTGLEIQSIPIYIYDRPAFSHRGLLIDTARNYYSLDMIKRIINSLMQLKFNVLHWHLTDNEGFSFGSTSHPEINHPTPPPAQNFLSRLLGKQDSSDREHVIRENEVMNNSRYYTHEEMKEVIAYAKARGVRVVPEIEAPAHTHSWAFAYPDSIVESDFDSCPFTSPLDVTNPHVYELLEDFMKEEALVFPDQFVHLGGDEIFYNCFAKNMKFYEKLNISAEALQMNLTSNTSSPLYWRYFWTKVLPIFNHIFPGKTPVIWDEWIDEAEGEYLGWKPVIQTWRGTSNLNAATSQGFRVINSYGWYLNSAPESCMTWIDCYSHHPFYYLPLWSSVRNKLNETQQKLVLGGEAAAWELSEQCFHERVWDRLTAVSERLWSNPPYLGQPINYGMGYCKINIDPTGTGSNLAKRIKSQLTRFWKRNNIDKWYNEVFRNETCKCFQRSDPIFL